MKSFDEWFKNEMPNSHRKVGKEKIETVIYSCAESACNHQQNKIACMQVNLDGANERAIMMLNHKNAMVYKMQAEVDELRKRIDEVIEYIGTDFDDFYTGVMVESIHEILKGENHES